MNYLSVLASDHTIDKYMKYMNRDRRQLRKNEFEFSVADGLAVDRRHLLRPANRSRRRDEHQRCPIHLPYQYDFPECLRSH